MMKKSIALLLAFAFLAVCSLCVSGETQSGDCGEGVVWEYDSESKVLTIEGTGAVQDWLYESAPWHEFYSQIKKVVITEGITRLGTYSFSVDGRYTVITAENSEPNQGEWTFTKRCNIEEIEIPNSVSEFGDYVFYRCKAKLLVKEGSAAYEYAKENNMTYDTGDGTVSAVSEESSDSSASDGESAVSADISAVLPVSTAETSIPAISTVVSLSPETQAESTPLPIGSNTEAQEQEEDFPKWAVIAIIIVIIFAVASGVIVFVRKKKE